MSLCTSLTRRGPLPVERITSVALSSSPSEALAEVDRGRQVDGGDGHAEIVFPAAGRDPADGRERSDRVLHARLLVITKHRTTAARETRTVKAGPSRRSGFAVRYLLTHSTPEAVLTVLPIFVTALFAGSAAGRTESSHLCELWPVLRPSCLSPSLQRGREWRTITSFWTGTTLSPAGTCGSPSMCAACGPPRRPRSKRAGRSSRLGKNEACSLATWKSTATATSIAAASSRVAKLVERR